MSLATSTESTAGDAEQGTEHGKTKQIPAKLRSLLIGLQVLTKLLYCWATGIL